MNKSLEFVKKSIATQGKDWPYDNDKGVTVLSLKGVLGRIFKVKTSDEEVDDFFEKHRRWVEKNIEEKRRRLENIRVTPEEEAAARKKALPYLTQRTEYFSEIMGLKPNGIKITSAQKRFGSCSGKDSICYSWRLMLYPPEAIDYVIVHELAHIVHKNHGAKFYSLIAKYMPDYKEREKMLK